ncbi:glycosyltransferase family 2 protein [Paenibacillus spiritus]|uniref:Glycosyltransferase family 2 protein n=1 Tax=Paenibacillus spiritus TaxID=2496557 RepID=A0A5J5GJV1_9BACL|nr:glycosyltransferase family 2 protein [Paenibacillus spiritus]KAA9008561.1 glycosyltransferase family 2 protein [Paenibacillus spiritus]
MTTSIIIPTYNGLPLLRSCIASIREATPEPHELLVIDNESDDGTGEFCRMERIAFISLPRNLGFPAACNYGLALASGDELLLLNNDVVVAPGWLANLKAALYSAPDIGLVGPVTNYASGRQQVTVDCSGPGGFREAAAKWNVPDPSRWRETRRLVGLCLLFRREVLEALGPLDERFSPGHYEDDDYSYRARLKGYRLLIAGDCLVHHEGSASFRSLRPAGWQELVERNRRQFQEKWGVDPLDFV